MQMKKEPMYQIGSYERDRRDDPLPLYARSDINRRRLPPAGSDSTGVERPKNVAVQPRSLTRSCWSGLSFLSGMWT